jgi:polar amino acid transport system substrate-binding protein
MTAPPRAELAALQRALAPTGVLRASINLGNPLLARRDADDQVVGVSVDLALGLADQLGLPLERVVFDTAAKSVDAVKTGAADIGFFAIDPLRGDGVCFTAPYLLIEGAYLVRNESPLTDNAQVDQPGTRVVVGQGSAYDLYLTRHLKAATLLRAPSSPAVVDRFLAEDADVAAGVKQPLQADAARLPGLRLLPGHFMVIQQAMGLQAGRGDVAEASLRLYVEQAKANGRVVDSLARHGIRGAAVAPPAHGPLPA